MLLGAGICAAAAATAHAAGTGQPLSLGGDLGENVSISITPGLSDQPGRAAPVLRRLLPTIDPPERVTSPVADLVRGPTGLHLHLDRVAAAELPTQLPDLLPGLAVRTLPALLTDELLQGPAEPVLGFLHRGTLPLTPSAPAVPLGPRPTGPVPALPAGTGAGAADTFHLTLGYVSPPTLTGLTPSPLWWTTADPSGLHPRDRAESPPFTPD